MEEIFFLPPQPYLYRYTHIMLKITHNLTELHTELANWPLKAHCIAGWNENNPLQFIQLAVITMIVSLFHLQQEHLLFLISVFKTSRQANCLPAGKYMKVKQAILTRPPQADSLIKVNPNSAISNHKKTFLARIKTERT